MPDTSISYVDPRGSRFAAWVTTAVLSLVLLTGWGPLLAAQTVVFAAGSALGMTYAPYGRVFRLVRRLVRLGPAAELEAEPPLRFAQAVGGAFGLVGTAGYLGGVTVLGTAATAIALAAAFLNAAFGFCLGCEIYLLLRRAQGRAAIMRFVPARTTFERSSA